MSSETNRSIAPWWIIDSDGKKAARLNAIRLVLSQMDSKGKTKDATLLLIRPEIVPSGIDHVKVLESGLMNPKRRH